MRDLILTLTQPTPPRPVPLRPFHPLHTPHPDTSLDPKTPTTAPNPNPPTTAPGPDHPTSAPDSTPPTYAPDPNPPTTTPVLALQAQLLPAGVSYENMDPDDLAESCAEIFTLFAEAMARNPERREQLAKSVADITAQGSISEEDYEKV